MIEFILNESKADTIFRIFTTIPEKVLKINDSTPSISMVAFPIYDRSEIYETLSRMKG